MIVCRTFQTAQDVVRYMRGNGLSLGDILGPYTNASGHYDIFYDNQTEYDTVIDTVPGMYGVAYGAAGAVPIIGTVIELGELRTVVDDEDLGAGGSAQEFAGTLGNTYVIPRSVHLRDSNGIAPALMDNGLGHLVEESNGAQRGTVDYATGVIAITWETPRKTATGNVLVDYEFSDLPDTSDFPEECELSRLVVTRSAGISATLAWSLFEESAMAYGPIASGVIAAFPASVDLAGAVSNTLELTLSDRGKRWLQIIPATDADSDFQVRVSWKRSQKQ